MARRSAAATNRTAEMVPGRGWRRHAGDGIPKRTARAEMFFGAGAAFLGAAMSQTSSSLRSRHAAPLTGRGLFPLWRLGFRSAAFRPSRSVLSIALIASAAFIIVSVDAFRRGSAFPIDIHSGTGGFALMAQSEVPIVANPNDAAGREALVVDARSSRARSSHDSV